MPATTPFSKVASEEDLHLGYRHGRGGCLLFCHILVREPYGWLFRALHPVRCHWVGALRSVITNAH